MSIASSTGGKHQRVRLTGVVLLMSFLFGNNFIALDVGLRHSGPITLQAIAVTFAFFSVWAVTWREELPALSMQRETLWAIVGVSMALSVASPILMAYGVERVNPAVAAMLAATTPIATLILERFVYRTRVDIRNLIAVAIGIGGVAFVVAPLGGEGTSEIIGVIVLIGASFTWATGLILTRRLRGVVGGGRFVIWQMAAALPVLFTLAFIIEGLKIEWTWAFLLGAGYSGVFAKGIASLLQFRTVRLSSPLFSSLAAFMVPVVATISTYLFLDETVLGVQLFGAALIAISVCVVIGSHRISAPFGQDDIQPNGLPSL